MAGITPKHVEGWIEFEGKLMPPEERNRIVVERKVEEIQQTKKTQKEDQDQTQKRIERAEKERKERDATAFTWAYDWRTSVENTLWPDGQPGSPLYNTVALPLYALSFIVYGVLWVAQLVLIILIAELIADFLFAGIIVAAIASLIKK